MAKIVKLTDNDYSHLKELARANGLTLAGEIRRMINLQRVVNAADVLGVIADRLEKSAAIREEEQKNQPSSNVNWDEVAKEMGYDI